MKILLVGEYSRLHNSLKEGLIALDHDVTLIATGDYFKDFPADIKLERKFEKGILKKWKVAIYRLLKIDIAALDLMKQFFKSSKRLKGFDVVQLINESPIGLTPMLEKKIIAFLKENNKKLFLLSCGTDYLSVKYAFEKQFKYSILTPYFEGKLTPTRAEPILKYLEPEFIDLHNFVYNKLNGVIASDLDYHIPLIDHPQYRGLVPNPINTDQISYIENPVIDKVIIFHGINRGNFYKKGNDFFENALHIINEKFNEKVEIIITEDIPYVEYIKNYDRAHILLDQVYAYDQGYNALEAMAKGKVVFTGAEQEFLDYYKLAEDEVCINALPDVDYLVEKLSRLINNPREIEHIGKNARLFIEKEHNYINIAKKYQEIWTN